MQASYPRKQPKTVLRGDFEANADNYIGGKLRDDRRFHGLSLTTDGEIVLTAVTTVIADQERRMEAALSAGEREILMTALRRIAGTLT